MTDILSAVFRSLLPSEYCESIYSFDFDRAYAEGKRIVLFDIDNTLVPHGAPADERSLMLVKDLKEKGFSLCAVSNNREPRVKSFCDAADIQYVYSAGKPKTGGYLDGIRRFGGKTGETVFFGDQIFTDILGANRAGLTSILVRPVDASTDEIQIRFKRILEKPLIKAFLRDKGIAINRYFY